ncbi:hypothetical protein BXZ70DRAFT_178279 [Cristinia sonorae]|uniref:Uncharacterized protein n=1 Tax=Cristinia sonorae TaxID=1940300 RepID=A0A8K0XPL4_9AGAR|nr:hypothetical protein BXZ70DRAFT_178279 [Cristinia sonorae]
MAGPKKRSADEAVEETGPTTRSAKVPKTTAKGAATSTKGKKGPKANLPANEFKSRALPLHINITHTPPSIPDNETTNATEADPGFIGTTALVPSVFSTGSYGWKGNKRITIELENRETGEKEKVQVMLTMNATVIGSKNAENGDGEEAKEEAQGDKEPEEDSGKAEAEESKEELRM